MSDTIGEVCRRLSEQNCCALVAYVTAGDPDLEFTRSIIIELARAGVDIIELGLPFTDPVGDGPTIQKSMVRALAHRNSIQDVLDIVDDVRDGGTDVPIVLFSYLNPIFKFGYRELASRGEKAGISGVLVVDLPPVEAKDYKQILSRKGLDTVFIASPLSSEARLEVINQWTSGFCYYMSRVGVTGGTMATFTSLTNEVKTVKEIVTKPVFVGFGISTPQQAQSVGKAADGVIVGSALVNCIEQSRNRMEATRRMISLAENMRVALDDL